MHVAGVVEGLADLDAASEQLLAGGLDVGDDQIEALRGAGRRRGDVLAEDDREPEPGGVNWITRQSSPAAKSASSRQPSSRRTPWRDRRPRRG